MYCKLNTVCSIPLRADPKRVIADPLHMFAIRRSNNKHFMVVLKDFIK